MHSRKLLDLTLVVGLSLAPPAALAVDSRSESPLSMAEAIRIAVAKEPGIAASELDARAREELSVASGTMPDPQLTIGLLNVPSDSFDFEQEPMTQLRLGVRQSFPRGRTREIRADLDDLESNVLRSEADLRRKEVVRRVSVQWLDLHYWIDTLKTLRRNRTFFADLVEITRSLYTLGQRDQQDLIHAQFELSRLDDQIAVTTESVRRVRNQIARWLGWEESARPLADELPPVPEGLAGDAKDWLQRHPSIRRADLEIALGQKRVELARQEYKPGWAVDVAYAYRRDDSLGRDRSDFLSAALVMDLPLFTEKRQDRRVRAMEYRAESLRHDRVDALRMMESDLAALKGDYAQTLARIRIYEGELLPQVEQRSTAALNAYQADAGDFADVMTAYIGRLNTMIDYRRLQVRERKLLAQIEYYNPDAWWMGGDER